MALPAPVRPPVIAFLAAVGAGVAETVVHLVAPDPPPADTPGAAALLVRGAIYLGVVALVLALAGGRNLVRWCLAVLLGGVGTLSLVIEPVSWLAHGGSPVAWLATADATSLTVATLRAVHVVAVTAGVVLMFRPPMNAFVRRYERGQEAASCARVRS